MLWWCQSQSLCEGIFHAQLTPSWFKPTNWLLRNPRIEPGMKGTLISRMLAGWDSGRLQLKTRVKWIPVAKDVMCFSCSLFMFFIFYWSPIISAPWYHSSQTDFADKVAVPSKPVTNTAFLSCFKVEPMALRCSEEHARIFAFGKFSNPVSLGNASVNMDLVAVSIYYVGCQSTKSAILSAKWQPLSVSSASWLKTSYSFLGCNKTNRRL